MYIVLVSKLDLAFMSIWIHVIVWCGVKKLRTTISYNAISIKFSLIKFHIIHGYIYIVVLGLPG